MNDEFPFDAGDGVEVEVFWIVVNEKGLYWNDGKKDRSPSRWVSDKSEATRYPGSSLERKVWIFEISHWEMVE